MTIYEILTDWRRHQQIKHNLPYDSVETEINKLSNYDFLKEISEAIEERLTEERSK
jgi:hypothetical protein